MAHELEFVNGQAQMAYVGEVPWHGLGTPVAADLSPYEMLVAAGLDWQVDKIPSYIDIDGKRVPTGQQALVRSSDHKILTNISDGWEPVQNLEAFEFFEEFVKAGEMEMHTAGSLKGGRHVWALAKVKQSFSVLKNDEVDLHLLFSNPHTYGRCVDIRFTPIRVVCNNTITLAINEQVDRFVRLNHRKKFDAESVKETLGIAKQKMAIYSEMAQFLASKPAAQDDVIMYLSEVFKSASQNRDGDIKYLSRPAEKALSIMDTQPGAELGRGTWWQAFNAVTFSIDHLLGNSTDTRLQSAWYGQNRQRKLTALNKAVEYAEAA